jgi:hypothetical protein
MGSTRGITIEREVLLFEIERRCSFSDCNDRIFVSLTKLEAREYKGFDCISCDRWNSDHLTKADVPDWWDELAPNLETTH